MKDLLTRVQLKINERVYLRDPDATKLGRRILEHSIFLIDEIGFESFTFKKLAERISSTEASIYRYFENKHKLLIYLVSWYWNWLEYFLVIHTYNVEDPVQRLRTSLSIICQSIEMDPNFLHIDESVLHRIVVAESAKAYLTKEVDADNKEGYFLSYKRLCHRLADMVREINPNYKYPTALISTAVESAHMQKFFSEHLKSLTEVSNSSGEQICEFLMEMILRTVGHPQVPSEKP